MNILSIICGSFIAIELIYSLVMCHQLHLYTLYLSKPFGIPFNMGFGFIVRFVLTAAGTILLYQGIIGVV